MKTLMTCGILAGAVIACGLTHAGPALAADAEAGKKSFNKCVACHSPDKGVNKIGPSLFGVVGRKAGTLEGYTYSQAMKDYGQVWNTETLNAYLTQPMQVVKGTKMGFMGLKDDTERANVIAYLETLK
jgi:cytochrome c